MGWVEVWEWFCLGGGRVAHTFFVLLDVTCSPYGINRMD